MKLSPMRDFVRNVRASPRALAGLLGGVLLIVSATGAYLATRSSPAHQPQPPLIAQRPFDFRPHAAPRALPDITFEDEKGKPLTLAHFRGKVVLLNIWATWCPPCRKEMPTLDRLQKSLGGDRFEVVALSIDRGGVSAVKKLYALAMIILVPNICCLVLSVKVKALQWGY